MPQLDVFNEQQSRFDRAFCRGGTCCDTTCEACGRTYFVTSPGHGDYLEGLLERLRYLADREPDKYIEVPDFSSISTVTLGGKSVVVGCLCDPTKPYTDFIEHYAEELTDYLKDYWKSKRERADADSKSAVRNLVSLTH